MGLQSRNDTRRFPSLSHIAFHRGEDYKIAVVTGKLSFSEERKESWVAHQFGLMAVAKEYL